MVKHLLLIGISLCSFAPAYADDSISIRYLNGYPMPGVSAEWVNLKVSRSGDSLGITPKQKRDIDAFFEEVSATLTSNKIAKDWQLAIPDAPAIEITIEIKGRKLQLTSCHIPLERDGKVLVTEHGAIAVSGNDREAFLTKESEVFRRHRAAFEKILALTLARAQARLSP